MDAQHVIDKDPLRPMPTATLRLVIWVTSLSLVQGSWGEDSLLFIT
jgi:hypothetical protein